MWQVAQVPLERRLDVDERLPDLGAARAAEGGRVVLLLLDDGLLRLLRVAEVVVVLLRGRDRRLGRGRALRAVLRNLPDAESVNESGRG
jgi:hypothetical protein